MSQLNRRGCANFLQTMIEREVNIILGKERSSPKRRIEAINFLFSRSLNELIDENDDLIDVAELQGKIFVKLFKKGVLNVTVKEKI